jgi:hypothetical protein
MYGDMNQQRMQAQALRQPQRGGLGISPIQRLQPDNSGMGSQNLQQKMAAANPNGGMQYQPMPQPDPNTGIQASTAPSIYPGMRSMPVPFDPNGGMQYQPMPQPDPNTGIQASTAPSMYPGMRSMPVSFDPNGGLQAGMSPTSALGQRPPMPPQARPGMGGYGQGGRFGQGGPRR